MTNSPVLSRAYTSDSTNASSLTQPADTTTEPTTGSGYVKRATGPMPTPHDLMIVVPISKGANNTTYLIRVYGVFLTDEGVYIHLPLYELNCTAGQAVGLTGKNVSDTHRYADTISVTALYGTENTNIQIFQQQADGRGFVTLDMFGALWAYLTPKIVSSATHMNALCGGI